MDTILVFVHGQGRGWFFHHDQSVYQSFVYFIGNNVVDVEVLSEIWDKSRISLQKRALIPNIVKSKYAKIKANFRRQSISSLFCPGFSVGNTWLNSIDKEWVKYGLSMDKAL